MFSPTTKSTSDKDTDPNLAALFAHHVEIINPLFITATKCQDSRLRAEAIALLTTRPLRERGLDSVAMARIAQGRVAQQHQAHKVLHFSYTILDTAKPCAKTSESRANQWRRLLSESTTKGILRSDETHTTSKALDSHVEPFSLVPSSVLRYLSRVHKLAYAPIDFQSHRLSIMFDHI